MTAGVSPCSHDKRWYIMKLLIHVKRSAVSETCNPHRSKMRIQIIQFHNSSAPLTTAELRLLAKPTGMSQAWNSLPLHPTVGQQAFRDQPFSVHKNPPHIYHIYIQQVGWLIYFTWMLPWNEAAGSCSCLCSMINTVLIKLISSGAVSQGETQRTPSLLNWMSTPLAPLLGSHRFLRGNSCWKLSRGCCDPGTNSHPATDQNDHCGTNRESRN